jgi:hypothetical protein
MQRYAGALGHPLKLNDELAKQRLLQPLPMLQHRAALEFEEFKIAKPTAGKELNRKLGMRARSKAKRIETPLD